MKKLLALTLAIVCCLSLLGLVSCGKKEPTHNQNGDGLTYTLRDDGESYMVTIWARDVESGSVSERLTILAEYKGKPVTEVSDLGTHGWNVVKHIDIPEGITTISYLAFEGMTLDTLKLPSTVTEIDSCFAGLTIQDGKLTIPAAVKKLNWRSFGDMRGDVKITFENTIGWYYLKGTEKIPVESSLFSDPSEVASNLKSVLGKIDKYEIYRD